MRKLAVGNEFVAAATTALGHPTEVIAGAEEARLVYSGVMQGRSPARPRRLVVDLGGRSTELILGRDDNPKLMDSLSPGCVATPTSLFGARKHGGALYLDSCSQND